MTKICLIPGCGCPVPEHQVMDHEHWRMVPLPLQKMITRLYNGGRPRDGYAEAVASAVDQVVDQLQGRG